MLNAGTKMPSINSYTLPALDHLRDANRPSTLGMRQEGQEDNRVDTGKLR